RGAPWVPRDEAACGLGRVLRAEPEEGVLEQVGEEDEPDELPAEEGAGLRRGDEVRGTDRRGGREEPRPQRRPPAAPRRRGRGAGLVLDRHARHANTAPASPPG